MSFVLFDAFCRRAVLGLARTKDSSRSVHTAAITFEPELPSELQRAFRKTHVRDRSGQDLVDFHCAALRHSRSDEHAAASRLFERALALDPRSVEILFQLGEACVLAGMDRPGLKYLRRGRRVDRDRAFGFDFLIGGIHARQGRLAEARRAYERALAIRETPATHANIGLVAERMGDFKSAYLSFRRFLDMESDTPLANNIMRRLVEQMPREWEHLVGESPTGAAEP